MIFMRPLFRRSVQGKNGKGRTEHLQGIGHTQADHIRSFQSIVRQAKNIFLRGERKAKWAEDVVYSIEPDIENFQLGVNALREAVTCFEEALMKVNEAIRMGVGGEKIEMKTWKLGIKKEKKRVRGELKDQERVVLGKHSFGRYFKDEKRMMKTEEFMEGSPS